MPRFYEFVAARNSLASCFCSSCSLLEHCLLSPENCRCSLMLIFYETLLHTQISFVHTPYSTEKEVALGYRMARVNVSFKAASALPQVYFNAFIGTF